MFQLSITCMVLQKLILQLSVTDTLLPPANEVLGKVIFSQVFVCPQGGGVCVVDQPGSSLPGGLHPGVSASRGGSASRRDPPQEGCWADPPALGYSGQYASYWNAFLFSVKSNFVRE